MTLCAFALQFAFCTAHFKVHPIFSTFDTQINHSRHCQKCLPFINWFETRFLLFQFCKKYTRHQTNRRLAQRQFHRICQASYGKLSRQTRTNKSCSSLSLWGRITSTWLNQPRPIFQTDLSRRPLNDNSRHRQMTMYLNLSCRPWWNSAR